MPWARFEDEFVRHPKVQRIDPSLRPAAIALQVAAVCYSAAVLSDGFVSTAVARSLCLEIGWLSGARTDGVRYRKLSEAMQQVGIWEQVFDGFQIHDYADYQPSSDEIKERRRAEREKKRKQRSQLRIETRPNVPARVPPGQPASVPGGQPEGVPGGLARTRAEARARGHPIPSKETPPTPPGGRRISKKELRRYTGCRWTRGSHGASYVRDSLGTDRPPPDWPHERPSVEEVEAALAEQNGEAESPAELVDQLAAEARPLEEIEAALAALGVEEDELVGLVERAADLARGQAAS